MTELEELKRERQSKNLVLDGFIQNLKGRQELLEEFDDKLWIMVVETVAVQQDGKLIFTFKNGTRITK